jgi:hypothetical protein
MVDHRIYYIFRVPVVAAFDYLEYVIGRRRLSGYDEAVSGRRKQLLVDFAAQK